MDKAPGSGPSTAATQGTAEKLLPEIRKRLAEMVKNAPADKPSIIADAVGIDLTMLPGEGSEADAWLELYAKRVSADDPTLARLRAWALYRAGKLHEAEAAF